MDYKVEDDDFLISCTLFQMDREESIFCEMRAENSCKIRVLVLLLQVRVFVLLLQVDGCACVPDMCRRGCRRGRGIRVWRPWRGRRRADRQAEASIAGVHNCFQRRWRGGLPLLSLYLRGRLTANRLVGTTS